MCNWVPAPCRTRERPRCAGLGPGGQRRAGCCSWPDREGDNSAPLTDTWAEQSGSGRRRAVGMGAHLHLRVPRRSGTAYTLHGDHAVVWDWRRALVRAPVRLARRCVHASLRGAVERPSAAYQRENKAVAHDDKLLGQLCASRSVSAKARDLMAPVLGAARTEQLIGRINRLETLDDIRQLRPLITT